jgi:hypothetical protein
VKALAAMVLTVGCLGCRNGEADATLEGCRKVRDPAEARREANRILGMELDQALRGLEGDYRLVWSNAWIPDGCFTPHSMRIEEIKGQQGSATVCDQYFEITMNCRVTISEGQGTICQVSSLQSVESSPANAILLRVPVDSDHSNLRIVVSQVDISSDRPGVDYASVHAGNEVVGFISRSFGECTGIDGCCPPMGDRIQ